MTDDEALIALIDNELDGAAREDLLARLAQDEALGVHLETLRQSRAEIIAGFDSLLEQAPLARLRAALPRLEAAAGAPARPALSWRRLAAALVVGLVLGAAAAAIGFGFSEREESDWRSAVVEYMRLYTRDTFAPLNPDAAAAAALLKGVGDTVGVALTPENIAVRDLRFRVAFNLGYEGVPLGEVAYTDAKGDPAAFCVIADGAKASPLRTETRGLFSYAAWSKDGKSYMLVGRMPEAEVAELAQPLVARF
jgi:anti-sigma factor RsiW